MSLFRLKWKTKKEAQYRKSKKLHVWCWLVLFSFHVETAVHTRWEHAVKHGEHVDETAAADWSGSRNPSSYVWPAWCHNFSSVDVIKCSSFKKKKPLQMNHVLPDFICAFLCFVTPGWENTPILIINVLNITSSKISSAFYSNDEFTDSDKLKLLWLNRTFLMSSTGICRRWNPNPFLLDKTFRNSWIHTSLPCQNK